MDSWEPVDIDRDGTEDEEYDWNDDAMKDLENRFGELRQFDKNLMKVAIRMSKRKRQSL